MIKPDDDKEKYELHKIKKTDILGYPAPVPMEKKPFYDLVLFFNDNGFIHKHDWHNFPGTRCYTKPENFEGLYRYTKNEQRPGRYYFSKNSVFTYTRKGEAYELELRSVRIFIHDSNFIRVPVENEAEDSETKEVTLENALNHGDTYFYFTKITENSIFNNYYERIKGLLVTAETGEKRKYAYYGAGATPGYYEIKIDFSEIPNIERLKVYLKYGEENNLTMNETDKTLTVTEDGRSQSENYEDLKLTIYENDPSGKFDPVTEKEKLKKELELGIPEREMKYYEGSGFKTYYGFKVGDETYYIHGDSEGPYGLEKKNYLNFGQFFDEVKGAENDIVYDFSETESILGRMLTRQSLVDLYRPGNEESREMRAKLRRLISKHPFEWNKDLYGGDFVKRMKGFALRGERLTNLENKMAKQDLWANPGDGVRTDIDELPKGNTWFAHPVYSAKSIRYNTPRLASAVSGVIIEG